MCLVAKRVYTYSMPTIVKADCSGCFEPFRLNAFTLTVTMTVPSNGKRGSLHAPAHVVTADATVLTTDVDGYELIGWDCPRCGYADSHEEGVQ